MPTYDRNDLRERLENRLKADWSRIFDNPHDHIHRTRVVNSVEEVVRHFLDQTGCQLAPICKHRQQ